MRQWFWLMLLPVMLGVWLLLVATGWLPPLSAQQREDLARLSAPLPPVEGSNAFATLWLAGFEVPPARRAELMQLAPESLPRALQREFPRRELDAEPFLQRCRDVATACLPSLRAEPEVIAAGLDRLFHLETERQALLAHSHYRDPRQAMDDQELAPPAVFLSWTHLASAFDAAEGRSMDALQRLCLDTRTWRRLRSGSNSLVFDMLMLRQLSLSQALFGEIMLELAPDTPLPAVCETAFAPLADAELDQCPSMQRDFRMIEATLSQSLGRTSDADVPDRKARRFFNLTHTLAVMVEPQARFCRDDHRARIAAREPMSPDSPQAACDTLGWAFNPFGCVLGDLGPGGHARYYLRLLDLDRSLQLAGLGLWLREQPVPFEQALAHRPAPFDRIEPRIEVDADGATRLRLDTLEPSAPAQLIWPLNAGKAEARMGSDPAE